MLGDFDNIIGAIGVLVGILGTITGTVGAVNINKAKNIAKNIGGNLQQATTINNGASYDDIENITRKQLKVITRMDDVEKFIIENPKYCLSLTWDGTQKEYDELEKNNEIIRNAVYYIE
jgi:hypothetical protein